MRAVRIRRAAITGVLFALAGCGPEAEPVGPPPLEASEATPAGAPVRREFVGRWAAGPELCAEGAWRFEAAQVTTAGGVVCEFAEVSPTPTGFDIGARCFAEGPPETHRFTLTLTDPAPPQRMTVTGGPWDGPITLVRCVD